MKGVSTRKLLCISRTHFSYSFENFEIFFLFFGSILLFRDILLGLVKHLITIKKSNLKILITSATLDGEKVSKFFWDCPVLNVPGKLYPVEILYSKERPKSYHESALKKALGI